MLHSIKLNELTSNTCKDFTYSNQSILWYLIKYRHICCTIDLIVYCLIYCWVTLYGLHSLKLNNPSSKHRGNCKQKAYKIFQTNYYMSETLLVMFELKLHRQSLDLSWAFHLALEVQLLSYIPVVMTPVIPLMGYVWKPC